MKKTLSAILALSLAFSMSACGSEESSGNGDDAELGEYQVEIVGCRKTKDYDGKPVVIVKYNFTNNSDEPTSFWTAFDDSVYQDGIGLNEAYFLDESEDYLEDNQMKEIKTGASLEVEVAYELNDTTTDIDVEVEELFSFDDDVVKKTLSLHY